MLTFALGSSPGRRPAALPLVPGRQRRPLDDEWRRHDSILLILDLLPQLAPIQAERFPLLTREHLHCANAELLILVLNLSKYAAHIYT